MRLSELRTGEKGVIVKVLGHGGFRKRIVEMGFIKGKTVEVILNAPLKDPIKYRLLGYEISLRRQEADMIEVVSEQEARTMQNPYHGSITEDVPVPESELVALAKGKRRTINVALVGNPNCGKTSLFNIASGAHEHVVNYSRCQRRFFRLPRLSFPYCRFTRNLFSFSLYSGRTLCTQTYH